MHQDMFYEHGPSGEKFYGAATQEMLDRVSLHFDSSIKQVPNQSKLRFTNKSTQPIYINY